MHAVAVPRFFTGVRFGAAMSNTIAMTSAYGPCIGDAPVVTTMSCCFTFGSTAAGFIVAHVITRYGWHGISGIDGVLPIALGLVMLAAPAESMRFLVHPHPSTASVSGVLRVCLLACELARSVLPDRYRHNIPSFQ
ncbi:hypothetical protein [Burkholderia lata]|uniref:hypothetical protein n=1 Tax=Burkholderia lata (strain ATCC 17760 / DSM 23089 / LMG 22485 / NCIMB 9086 / R18194 / 383) TaxID=482957 RepID=UPI001583321C|nr:hypothetical protein [Burkholderia lata]